MHSVSIVFVSYITVNRHQAAQTVKQCRLQDCRQAHQAKHTLHNTELKTQLPIAGTLCIAYYGGEIVQEERLLNGTMEKFCNRSLRLCLEETWFDSRIQLLPTVIAVVLPFHSILKWTKCLSRWGHRSFLLLLLLTARTCWYGKITKCHHMQCWRH